MADPGPESIARELAVLRGRAGCAPLDDRVVVAVTGADRASFLQGMLTNEVARLAPGQGCRALLLTDQGRLVAEVRVAVRPSEIRLDVARDRADALCAALERLVVADDVELGRPPDVGTLLVGPDATDVLRRAAGGSDGDPGDLAPWANRDVSIGGVEVFATRIRDRGLDGFALWTRDGAAADRVRAGLGQAGAESVSAAALEVQRVAAGDASFPADWDERNLGPEVLSLADAISYRKGCYLGQEVVERVAARGHVNWIVTRLAADSGVPPAPGSVVSRDGQEVGRVTSSAVVPPTGEVVLIARVRREAATEGALEVVDPAGAVTEARVLASDAHS